MRTRIILLKLFFDKMRIYDCSNSSKKTAESDKKKDAPSEASVPKKGEGTHQKYTFHMIFLSSILLVNCTFSSLIYKQKMHILNSMNN